MRVSIRIGAAFLTTAAGICVAQEAHNQENEPLGVLVIRDGDRQVEALKATLERHNYAESPLANAAKRNPGLVQAQVGLLGISAMAGVSPWEGVGLLLGEQTIIGVAPGEDEKPRFVGVSTLRDPERADLFIDAVLTVAGLQVAGEPREGATRQVSGRPVYVADELHLCRMDDMLVVANDAAMMAAAIEGLEDGVPDLPSGVDADAAPLEADFWAAIDVETLRGAGVKIPDKLPDAFGGLLFGGWAKSFADADRVLAWGGAEKEGLALTIDVHRNGEWPNTHRGYLASDARLPALSLDRTIGEIVVTREWASLFGERESLLTFEASGKLVEFATNLTAVMGQLDFMEEVLPRMAGPVRVIAVNREPGELDVDPTPTLPAFAMVAPMELDAGDLAQRLYSGAQMLMTIVNFESAQKGQPALMMDIGEHRGVKMVTGTYSPPQGDGVAGPQYNFDPAMAAVNGQLVISSTQNLLRSIIDRSLDDQRSADGEQDRAWINGDELAAILAENREEMIAKDMLDKGKTRDAASRDLDALLGVLRMIEGVSLDAAVTPEGGRATLKIDLESP